MWIVVWFPANPIYFGPFEERQDAVDYAKALGTGAGPFEVSYIHTP